MLVSLKANIREIKKQNKFVRTQRKKYKDDDFWIQSKDIKSMDDFCLSYDKYINTFSNEEKIKYFKVPDTIFDFTGVYITDLNPEGYLSRLVTPHLINNKERLLYFHGFGVCDNASQAIKEYERLLENGVSRNKKHIIVMVPIFKKDNNNWRWGKWGKYIGIQNKTTTYLGDEEDIEMIYFYKIEEVED